MKPGSFLWFVAHDMRQHWRSLEGLFGEMSRGKVAFLLAAAILALHGLAYPAALWLNKDSGDGDRLPAYVASGVLFVLPWIVAQAMTATTRALYTRGNLDLLFAAPVSARAVLAARAVAIAADGVASVAILLLPLANMNAALGHWRWLALYPSLVATGLFGSGLGIALAFGLFSAVGPRRARLASQIAATLIGACFVLGLQALSMLPAALRSAVMAALAPPQTVALDDPRSLLWLPALAASGDGRALVLWGLAGLVVFSLAALSFGKRFTAASMSAFPPARQPHARAITESEPSAPASARPCAPRSGGC